MLIKKSPSMTFLNLHRKLGHVNYDTVIELIRERGEMCGLTVDMLKEVELEPCMECAQAKIRQFKVPKKVDRRTGVPFQKGSIDIWGPVQTKSVGGNRFGLMYICDDTSYGFVEFLETKEFAELSQVITKWKLKVKGMGFDMEMLQFDADPVFENQELQAHLANLEVNWQYAPPGEHRANGLVERMIQTVVYMARTMLLASGLPERYWPYAIQYAMLIYNHLPKSRFDSDPDRRHKGPVEIVTGLIPVEYFPIFGALAVARIPDANELDPFSYRGRECAILGRDPEHQYAYILLNLQTKRAIISKDVIINEGIYGYSMTRVDKTAAPITDVDLVWTSMSTSEGGNATASSSTLVPMQAQPPERQEVVIDQEENVENSPTLVRQATPATITLQSNRPAPQPRLQRNDSGPGLLVAGRPAPTDMTSIRPHRAARDRNWKTMYETRIGSEDEDDDDKESEHWSKLYKTNMLRLMNGYDEGYEEDEVLGYKLNVTHKYVGGQFERVPQSYDEATSPDFIGKYGPAIQDEIESIVGKGTFGDMNAIEVPTDPASGVKHKPITCKWVFDIKLNDDGTLKKYKARLVGKGFMQRYGESYLDVFAPTASKDSLRMILAIAAMYGLETIQVDVKTAFLNGTLPMQDELYC